MTPCERVSCEVWKSVMCAALNVNVLMCLVVMPAARTLAPRTVRAAGASLSLESVTTTSADRGAVSRVSH